MRLIVPADEIYMLTTRRYDIRQVSMTTRGINDLSVWSNCFAVKAIRSVTAHGKTSIVLKACNVYNARLLLVMNDIMLSLKDYTLLITLCGHSSNLPLLLISTCNEQFQREIHLLPQISQSSINQEASGSLPKLQGYHQFADRYFHHEPVMV